MNVLTESSWMARRVAAIAEKQKQGLIPIETHPPQRGGLPFPVVEIPISNRDRFGRYHYDSEASLHIFEPHDGEMPESWKAYPIDTPLKATDCIIHGRQVWVDSGRLKLDVSTSDRPRDIFEAVNKALAEDRQPLVATRLLMGKPPAPAMRLSNGDAMVYAYSAVWSPVDQQLVAASVVSSTKQVLQAIRATLATNSNQYVQLHGVPGEQKALTLQNAKRGFIRVGNSLEAANAQGYAEILLHPATGDPRHNRGEESYFYVVVERDETCDLATRFTNRLSTAIVWPVLSAWNEYLLQAGQEAELVSPLPCVGPTFESALRVSKSDSAWETVIQAGFTGGHLSF